MKQLPVKRARPGSDGRTGIAALFLAGTLAQRAMGLLLLPMFLNRLTPHDYGLVLTWTAVGTVLSIALAFGLGSPVSRALAAGANDAPYDQVVRAAARLSLWGFIASSLLGAVCIPLIRSPGLVAPVAVVATALAQGSAEMFALPFLRTRGSQAQLVGYLATLLTLGVGGRVLGVIALSGGIRAWLLADLISTGCALGLTLSFSRRTRQVARGEGEIGDIRIIRSFVPFTIHQLSLWVAALGDRLVVAGVLGPGALAVYGLSGQFESLGRQLLGDINRSAMVEYAPGRASTPRAYHLLTLQVLGSAGVVHLLSIGSTLFLYLFAPVSYAEARVVAPILLAGCIPLAVYLGFMNLVTMHGGHFTEAWRVTVPTSVASVLIVAAGASVGQTRGAAYATTLSSVLMAGLAAGLWLRTSQKSNTGSRSGMPLRGRDLYLTLAAFLALVGEAYSSFGVKLVLSSATLLVILVATARRARELGGARNGRWDA